MRENNARAIFYGRIEILQQLEARNRTSKVEYCNFSNRAFRQLIIIQIKPCNK